MPPSRVNIPPGHISTVAIEPPFTPGLHPSLHTMDLAGLLAFGEALGMRLPCRVRVVTVEAHDLYTFHEACTPPVERAIPAVVDRLLAEIRCDLADLHEITPRNQEAFVQ
jgi:Ni,Fe-hydrogenase maturation factor